ncbi:hypothetical protein HanIR_Chr07g0300111 [Helianthus annuus]|nr:hypothetical protein HanIR_Chr07g0300111 [Helianthus annuus]
MSSENQTLCRPKHLRVICATQTKDVRKSFCEKTNTSYCVYMGGIKKSTLEAFVKFGLIFHHFITTNPSVFIKKCIKIINKLL